MKAGKRVKITKLSPTENPNHPTPNKEDYIYGQDNGYNSLFNGYTLTGTLLFDISVNFAMVVERDSRNNIPIAGVFRSSVVKKVEGNKAYTTNSVYVIEEIC